MKNTAQNSRLNDCQYVVVVTLAQNDHRYSSTRGGLYAAHAVKTLEDARFKIWMWAEAEDDLSYEDLKTKAEAQADCDEEERGNWDYIDRPGIYDTNQKRLVFDMEKDLSMENDTETYSIVKIEEFEAQYPNWNYNDQAFEIEDDIEEDEETVED